MQKDKKKSVEELKNSKRLKKQKNKEVEEVQ